MLKKNLRKLNRKNLKKNLNKMNRKKQKKMLKKNLRKLNRKNLKKNLQKLNRKKLKKKIRKIVKTLKNLLIKQKQFQKYPLLAKILIKKNNRTYLKNKFHKKILKNNLIPKMKSKLPFNNLKNKNRLKITIQS